MPAVPQFDTLRYVETLTAAGVTEPQARAGAQALASAFSEWGSGFLATKGDIFEVKSEIAAVRSELKSEIAALRNELKGDIATLRSELKSEIAALRSELKGEIAAVRSELKGEIAAVRSELKGEIAGLRVEQADIRSELKLVKWMNVTIVAAIVSYVARSFF